MTKVASYLMAASAALPLVLGLLHLLYTFRGNKLTPRDADIQERMSSVSLVVSRETTMWHAWIGFNASHALGLILFGLAYGYLALLHPTFLFQSWFLVTVGFVLLNGYMFLSMRYWFSTPFRGILLALILYVFAVISAIVWGT